MYYEMMRRELSLKNPKKKIIDSLKIVGLDFSYLNRNINSLSTSEKKQLELAISLLSNPEVIVIYEPLNCFDKNNTKKMIMLYQRMKEQYNKTIIFISDDINMLHKYTDNMIIVKNDDIVIEDETSKIFKNTELLKSKTFEIPEIIQITYLANKNKGIKME